MKKYKNKHNEFQKQTLDFTKQTSRYAKTDD